MNEEIKIENLKKISMSFEAGTSEKEMDLISVPVFFEFIYGIGKEGLVPFENEIYGKKEGDITGFAIPINDIDRFFAHIPFPIWKIFKKPEKLFIKMKVEKIISADGSEVVKAISEIVEGCSCGCGCCD
jgi:hypothetical protein